MAQQPGVIEGGIREQQDNDVPIDVRIARGEKALSVARNTQTGMLFVLYHAHMAHTPEIPDQRGRNHTLKVLPLTVEAASALAQMLVHAIKAQAGLDPNEAPADGVVAPPEEQKAN